MAVLGADGCARRQWGHGRPGCFAVLVGVGGRPGGAGPVRSSDRRPAPARHQRGSSCAWNARLLAGTVAGLHPGCASSGRRRPVGDLSSFDGRYPRADRRRQDHPGHWISELRRDRRRSAASGRNRHRSPVARPTDPRTGTVAARLRTHGGARLEPAGSPAAGYGLNELIRRSLRASARLSSAARNSEARSSLPFSLTATPMFAARRRISPPALAA